LFFKYERGLFNCKKNETTIGFGTGKKKTEKKKLKGGDAETLHTERGECPGANLYNMGQLS